MTSANREMLLDPAFGSQENLSAVPVTVLQNLLVEAPDAARDLLAVPEDRFDAGIVYRNVGAIMAEALRRQDTALFSEGVTSVGRIWELGDPKAMWSSRTPDAEASLWENLVIELYALGGLTVRTERWHELRELASRTSPSQDETWLRQGQVASARTASPEDSLPRLAARRVTTLQAGLSELEALQAVCRFDLVSALIVSESDDAPHAYYPNAAEFSENLVEQFVIDELRRPESPLRQFVFKGDNERLRQSLRAYDAFARSQAAYARRHGAPGEWRAFFDARTWNFIDEGHILEEWERLSVRRR